MYNIFESHTFELRSEARGWCDHRSFECGNSKSKSEKLLLIFIDYVDLVSQEEDTDTDDEIGMV